MKGNPPHRVEALSAFYGEREDDGERDFRVRAVVTANGDEAIDLVRLSIVYRNPAGLPFLTDEHDEEVDLEDGDSETVEAWSFVNYDALDGACTEVTVSAFGLHRQEAGAGQLQGVGCLIGSAEPVHLVEGVQLTCWALLVQVPDEDGDCPVQFMGSLRNDSGRPIDKASLSARLFNRKDDEVSCAEVESFLPTGTSMAFEDTAYVSLNKAKKPLRASIVVDLFHLLGSETTLAPLEEGPEE